MKTKFIMEDVVGEKHVRLEMEDECAPEEVGKWLETLSRSLKSGPFELSSPNVRQLTDMEKPASGQIIDACKSSANTGSRVPANKQIIHARTPAAKMQGFTPASEPAIKALWGAARNNGTDLETVCMEYNVDPERISKSDCWRMTQELNKLSGYEN